jgi:hypothetical protein
MSDLELKTRFGLVDAIKWRLLRGGSVIVAWPEWCEVTVDHNDLAWVDWGGAVRIIRDTDDPNWHYRPFLDKNIGKFGKDWMWRVRGCALDPNIRLDPWGPSTLEIRLHKRKAKWASILQLKWSSK